MVLPLDGDPCCAIALNEPMLPGLRREEGREDGVGWFGRVENVMEPALLSRPGLLKEEECRTCGAKRCSWVVCATGACAIWAMPPPFKSILRRVVGFVLAAMLRNVRGSDRYDDEEREGDGEGGALGGSGRSEASSSASKALAGDQMESRFREDWSERSSSGPYD